MNRTKYQSIESKIQLILKCLTRLQQFSQISLENYLEDFDQQLIAERLLQVVVEAASDINSDLLVELYQDTPETYFDSFIKAGRRGVINLALAEQLAQAAGMRNRLVHQYDEIDHRIVFAAIPMAVNQFSQYVQAINLYLNRLDESREPGT
ncbi:DUF86 domain-containing protein [Leptolyngbya sp. NK1-12]|uniref:DUF86 domain-containing protein n=1 Tax=Leptolyngbya sp. NK1-12 TaxID=2547451 RepID=A0AA96WMF5_9CYAN|nr:DUF86 domain-containing protein [Leptolyngbya sp. NK1-12]MBF2050595.1 DUF86 domain-containing protein [Elainella sp. C42_A2020_010]WNZ27819.1 DUF86 domain-containing protein [Leptolyngbya sp. NK1-12]